MKNNEPFFMYILGMIGGLDEEPFYLPFGLALKAKLDRNNPYKVKISLWRTNDKAELTKKIHEVEYWFYCQEDSFRLFNDTDSFTFEIE
ncbi:phosphoenolpyruvate-protein phosphotransferase [Weissella oryzae SG25]|uniref:Phosphoenolpyruvate-protein phosphotransferase n=1 Tax=Weissella oryzae (strain DSM 25784 / JCM 18191 / LMG 30913 / SG25) TaxID=1329250 RepID=A0A069CU63_WEIOS|nr:hypothetical protein [Weissella oryzae]GAK31044.1 phosphoenolpyruvate-protein phosphotransferase [Weissella oryzae SG25]